MPEKIAETIATVVLAKGRRTTGGYFKACCPAHDDQRPSLLIFVKADGRLSFRCLAGCPTRRIKMALRQRGVGWKSATAQKGFVEKSAADDVLTSFM